MDSFPIRLKFVPIVFLIISLGTGCGEIGPPDEDYSDRIESRIGESVKENAPEPPGLEPEMDRETPAAETIRERSPEKSIAEKEDSPAEEESHIMGRIGSDLGLRLFLERIEANVGRATYDSIVTKWGEPYSLKDGGLVVIAVWRWGFPGEEPEIKDVDETGSRTMDHGEQVSLTFNKSNRVLTGWQYGSW